MKFGIVNTNKDFNIVRFKYLFLGFAIIFTGLKLYESFNDYKTYLHHRVEVFYNSGKNPYQSGRTFKFSDVDESNLKIPNGDLDVRPQVTYTVKAKSYFQYFILDFNPDERQPFTFYFLINYLVIALILFFALRKSNNQRIFTKELLIGLSYLRIYIIVMMVMKFVQCYLIKNYIEEISNHRVSYNAFKNVDILEYQFYLLIFLFIISFVKEGLNLQKEQDLTV